MIIMQYKFTLPADYDMKIVEERIEKNGSKLNGFPGLFFKAYLISNRNENNAKENSYAPLYVWENSDAMNVFLQSAGFKKLTEDFGWPKIDVWTTLQTPDVVLIKKYQWLSIDKINLCDYADLSEIPMTSHLCGWDVSQWQVVNINFQNDPVENKNNFKIKYLAS